ncbi:MAG: HU family DNA-binding protein [Bacteroidales bacterium]|nr:HU family DNA-binding protein [Candidatus Colicola faecequi]
MNKTELVAAIAAKAELSKVAAAAALDATLATIEEELKAGNSVQLIGFGTFAVKETPAHEGINPATKAKIQIAAKKAAKFKAGAKLATL